MSDEQEIIQAARAASCDEPLVYIDLLLARACATSEGLAFVNEVNRDMVQMLRDRIAKANERAAGAEAACDLWRIVSGRREG